MLDDFPLDKMYRDRITGFEGVAIAKSEFLSGNQRLCLERGSASCSSEEMWIDVKRVEPVDESPSVGFQA